MAGTEEQTFGKFLLNEALPPGYKATGPLTSKNFSSMMSRMAHDDPRLYAQVVPHLKRVGDSIATTEGLSIGLDDIEPDYKTRDAALAPHIKKFDAATNDTARKAIVEDAQSYMQNNAMEHKGTMTQQVKSGSRGKAVQYTAIVSTPTYARDGRGSTEPWLIRHSYSEGLHPSENWIAGNEAILNTIKSRTSIAEPGEISKILINNLSDIIITESDCGTHNGIQMDPRNPDVVDRFLAKATQGFPYNTLITPLNQPKLIASAPKVLVRSPMTCEAGDGVCQKCQGLNEKGAIHDVGTNIGVRAAQAMSEPLTQFALNVRHGVRIAADDRLQVGGISGLRQIMESPQQFINKSTLSSIPGKVTKIEEAPQGGHFVYVNTVQFYVTPNLKVIVKIGDYVEPGDMLSEGIPKPDEVVKYKGLGHGRQYIVDSLKKLYIGQGKDMDQRHFEILSKGELNHVRIVNDPSNTFLNGDVVSYNALRSSIGKNIKIVPTEDALGETLGKEYIGYSVGTRITPPAIKFLKDHGVKEVVIAPRAPEVEFVMKPATRAPLLNPDWLARLAHRNLKTTLQQAAHFGEVTDIHGTHPVPAYVFGVEFGQGEKGRY